MRPSFTQLELERNFVMLEDKGQWEARFCNGPVNIRMSTQLKCYIKRAVHKRLSANFNELNQHKEKILHNKVSDNIVQRTVTSSNCC